MIPKARADVPITRFSKLVHSFYIAYSDIMIQELSRFGHHRMEGGVSMETPTLRVGHQMHCKYHSRPTAAPKRQYVIFKSKTQAERRGVGVVTRASSADGQSGGEKKKKQPPSQMLVYVPPHPLVKHWMGVMRSIDTPTPVFRSAAAELGRILLYEMLREWMPTLDAQVQTPTGSTADATFVDPTRPIICVPVLRAGTVLLDQSQTLLPASITYHVGYVRNEENLEASCYLNKLPEKIDPNALCIVSDMMLATGGTMVQVIKDMVGRGADPSNIRIVSALAAPPALQKLNDAFPGLVVYTGMIDAEVDEKGYIIPGVGDAGDRAFGTL